MDKSPPSPIWYVAAFALWAAGWMIGVSVAGSAWDTVRQAPISSANQALQAKGESIAVFTDVVQTDRRITCSMLDVVRDAEPVRVPPAPIALTVEDDGSTWTLVAFEPEGRDNVTVSCAPRDRQVDNAQYAYAVVDGYAKRQLIGVAMLGAVTVSALAMAVIVFVTRRRRIRPQ